jgi:zinc protease
MFIVQFVMRPGKDPLEVEKLVYEELERFKTQPVTDAELEKARMLVKRTLVQQLQSSQMRARNLGEAAVYYDDPNLVNTWDDKYNEVTKERIQQAARTYLVESNRTVVTTVPKPQAPAAAPAGQEE